MLIRREGLHREGRWFSAASVRVRVLNDAHVTGASASERAPRHVFQSTAGTPASGSWILALRSCELGVGQRPFLIFSLVSWLLFCSIMVADCVIFSLNTESKQARLYTVLTFI